MRDLAHHPSRLQLDLHLAGVAGDPLAAYPADHLADCPRCQARLERMASDYSDFLERYPTPASLERPGRSTPDLPEPALSSSTPRRRLRVWGAAAAVAATVAAAVVVGLLWIPPGRDAQLLLPPTGTERVKGGSVVEIAVKRDGASTRFEGQPLQSGDVLAFRVTTDRRYLLLVSVEETGRINVFLTDPSGQHSMAITPGPRQVLPRGVELDDYVGPERLLAMLTDRPLSVATVRRELQKLYRALSAPRRRTLDLGPPGFEGDTITWLLTKVAP